MSDELLSFERYAEVLAHMQHFGDPHAVEVRRRLGVTEDSWASSEKHWVDALYRDTGGDKPVLAVSFAKLYGAVSAKLASDKPPLETLGRDAEDGEALSKAEEPASAEDDAPAPPARVGDAEGAAPDAPPIVAKPETADKASPWAKADPLADAPAAAPPVLRRPPAVQPASVPEPEPPKAAEQASPPVAPRAPAAVMPPAVVAAAPAPTSAPATPAANRPEAIDETAMGVLPIADEPLPFKAGSREATRAKLAQNVADSTHTGGGQTAFVPAILSDGNETLPFLDVSALKLDEDIRERFTLEQYASLCAELAVFPDRRAHTLERYGIGEEAYARLAKAWKGDLNDSPQDKQKFDSLVAHYRNWLTQNR